MQIKESQENPSAQPNVCEFLKAVMTRVNPLRCVPQLSVWYLRVTKLDLVMMNPLEPTEEGLESQEMWAWQQEYINHIISSDHSPSNDQQHVQHHRCTSDHCNPSAVFQTWAKTSVWQTLSGRWWHSPRPSRPCCPAPHPPRCGAQLTGSYLPCSHGRSGAWSLKYRTVRAFVTLTKSWTKVNALCWKFKINYKL